MRGRYRGMLLTAAIGAVLVAGLLVSPERVLGRLRAVLYAPWFPLALLGLYLVRPALAWPITAISALVGYRYGLALGFAVAIVGVVITSLPAYAAGRYGRTDAGWVGRLSSGSQRYFEAVGDLRGVVVARLAPMPAEPISAAAGAGRVALPAFVLGTLVGELPWTLAAVFAGSAMRRFTVAEAAPDPWLVVGLLLVAAIVAAGPTYRYVRGDASARE